MQGQGFLPLAMRDPAGGDTFDAIAREALSAPGRLVGLSLVGWVMLFALFVIGWRAWRWARQVPADSAVAARIGLSSAAVLFITVLTVWACPGL